MQITCFQHIVIKDIHYHSKMQEREHNEEILYHSKTENLLRKLQTLNLWCQSALQIFNSVQLFGCNIFLPLSWFYYLLVSDIPWQIAQKNLESLTSWGVQGNKTSFNFKTSQNFPSSPPFKDTLDTLAQLSLGAETNSIDHFFYS